MCKSLIGKARGRDFCTMEPFSFLDLDKDEKAILKKYDVTQEIGEIVAKVIENKKGDV